MGHRDKRRQGKLLSASPPTKNVGISTLYIVCVLEILSSNVVILSNNVVILSNNDVILSNNDVILTLPVTLRLP